LNDQILKDGGPVERSFSYHRFVLNLYWLAIDFLEKNSFYDCSDFKEHLNKAEHFLMAFEDPFGRLPPIGDSDGGHAIAPGLYSRRIPLDCNSLKIKNFFITGYSIIKDNDAVLTFDHGPLGMAPLYNHGHSDALSITLSVNNKEIIVDPGTYRYHGRPEFRKYFKSTRAHNTITIDGMDQAVQETGFIWSRPYTSELIKSEKIDGGYFIQACHNGYLRLKEPLVHWRSIVYLGKRKFIIKDSFSGNGVHLFEINYHLHPNAEVTQEDSGWWKINNQGAEIYIGFLDKKKLFTFAKGQKDPLLGWYSTSYGIKCESGVLSYAEKGNIKEVSFLTAIDTEAPLNLESIRGRIFQIEKQIEHF
jgi:hypothetical protein